MYAQGDFKWTDRLIEKAISKLRESGALATIITDCPYHVRTFTPWFVDKVSCRINRMDASAESVPSIPQEILKHIKSYSIHALAA